MTTKLVKTVLMDNSWSKPINKIHDVIGLDGLGLNLQLEVAVTGTATPPPVINARFQLKEPHLGRAGKSSAPWVSTNGVFRYQQTMLYRLQFPDTWFASMMGNEGRGEFVTIVRANDPKMPATADRAFQGPLLRAGWAWRGRGVQPKSGGGASGNVATKEPEADRLLFAGGVELLDITIPPQAGLILNDAHTWGFFRSPADVVFYTGHGMGGNLVTHEPHDDWVKPEQLLDYWGTRAPVFRKLFDIDVLIINGCSVLNCDDAGGSGMRWAKLLMSRDGPLSVLLGYRGGVPSDTGGGAAVAARMAERIAGGPRQRGLRQNWDEYPQTWLDVNKEVHKAIKTPPDAAYTFANACAIDQSTYWVLAGDRLDVKKKPLPS
jgi:hypothetical protein